MATVEALKDKKDIELLKAILKEKSIRYYLLFLIGCNTGLRIGDILRLKVSDFINQNKSIKKYISIREQKTNKERKIAVNVSIQKGIKLFIDTYTPPYDAYMFVSRKGDNKPIATTQAYRVLNEAAAMCNWILILVLIQ